MSEAEWWIATVNEDGEVEHVESVNTEPASETWTTETTYGTHWQAVGATQEEAVECAKESWSRRVE